MIKMVSLLIILVVSLVLPAFGEENYIPVSSPNGDMLLLSRPEFKGLYLGYIGQDKLVEITSTPGAGYHVTWSLDGQKIGFKLLVSTEEGEYAQIPVIYNVQKEQGIYLCDPVERAGIPSFSKYGDIAFSKGEEVFIVNSNLEVKSTILLGNYSNLTPISPNGDKIAYNDNQDNIWVVNVDGTDKRQVTDGMDSYFSPLWSEDGTKLLVSTINGTLKVIDIVQDITYTLDKGDQPSWSGEDIIYSHKEIEGDQFKNSDIYLIHYTGSKKTAITSGDGRHEAFPCILPDKNRILYSDYMTNDVFIGTLERSSDQTRMAESQKLSFSKPLLSPSKFNTQSIKSSFINTTRGEVVISGVPYLHQVYDTPNNFNGRAACGATSAMMAISYYKILPYWDCVVDVPYSHTSHYGRYICQKYTYGGTTFDKPTADPNGKTAYGGFGFICQNNWEDTKGHMAEYFKKHGISSSVDWSPSWAKLTGEIASSNPVVLLTSLTTSGHYVLAIGNFSNQHTVILNDPYGNKNSGYMNYSGAKVRYDWPGYNNGYSNLNTVHCFIYSRK